MASWNSKYWDILNNFYWEPSYIGLTSYSQKNEKLRKHDDGFFVLRRDLAPSYGNGPLYSRALSFPDLLAQLSGYEEILNHIFNITFAIAADSVVSKLFLAPLQIDDAGPFESIGREISERYAWGPNTNITQQDGLFVSKNSAVGVELKLGTASSNSQLVKYAALLAQEEIHQQKRLNLGLLFVVPENALSKHWTKIGLTGPKATSLILNDETFVGHLNSSIKQIVFDHRQEVAAVLDRLTLAVVSWRNLRDAVLEIRSKLDTFAAGDQTLHKLLTGFLAQLCAHKGTDLT